MYLSIDQPGLLHAVRLLGRVVPARATLPILKNLLVTAEPGRVVLRASNVELSVATALAADVSAPGQVTIPSGPVAEWVAELPAERLVVRLDPATQRVQARCGRYTAQFATVPVDEFPTLPTADPNTAVDLAAAPLRAAIRRVVFAAAPDDQRPALATVRLSLGPEGLALAACDGFRLALARAPGSGAGGEPWLVPAPALAQAAHLLDAAEAARLLVAPDGRALHLLAGSTTLTALLVQAPYPDVDRLVPAAWRTRITVACSDLERAVDAARLFGRADSGHRVLLEAGAGSLHVCTPGDERGDATGALPTTLEGAAQSITVNARLLLQVLNAAETHDVALHWSDPHQPLVIREVGSRPRGSLPPDPGDLWLLMPLKNPATAAAATRAAA